RFCLSFVPLLSRKMATFREDDELLVRCVFLVAKLVGGEHAVAGADAKGSARQHHMLGGSDSKSSVGGGDRASIDTNTSSVNAAFGGGSSQAGA
ncbi:unnamed protein product, partial [Amoebophrya sp. A25]